ncbi:MAG: response regulator transcription factor [Oscillospiraceae bacterium]|jgi:DNA-binding response OmpR family regulator|nr:response regulator transcription factor [Oscillospiraceae bacterium]
MPNILIIEDEAKIARFLELELTHEGYQVKTAADGRSGLEQAVSGEWKPDALILDLMLPGLSGIEVCRRIRAGEQGAGQSPALFGGMGAGAPFKENKTRLPILMLTAKDDIMDKVMGLDTGADDYMTKPFAIEELLARLRVILARTQRTKNQSDEALAAGGLILHPKSHEATLDGKPLTLTKTEYDLLLCLMRRPGQALTRDFLLETVWGYAWDGDNNVVDVYIRYLRSKIEVTSGEKYIHTIRGVGYLFRYEKSEP